LDSREEEERDHFTAKWSLENETRALKRKDMKGKRPADREGGRSYCKESELQFLARPGDASEIGARRKEGAV